MLKKLNSLMNILIGVFIGIFIGHTVYIYWEYRNYPELYAMRSAPWYVGVLLYGLCTIAVVLIAVIVKLIIRRKMKKH